MGRRGDGYGSEYRFRRYVKTHRRALALLAFLQQRGITAPLIEIFLLGDKQRLSQYERYVFLPVFGGAG
jgi:hypothetical protein